MSGEEKKQLVESSSSLQQGEEKRHVVIYHHVAYSGASLVCVPVDSLISSQVGFEERIKKFKPEHPKPCPGCICTTSVGGKRSPGPHLYFFGGVGEFSPVPGIFGAIPLQLEECFVNKVNCYDLHKLPEEVGSVIPCNDMIYAMSNPLLAQVGDDCIYVLGHGKKTQADEDLEPAFLEYNLKEDKWTLRNEEFYGIVDIIENSVGSIGHNIRLVPHVVIGGKLHVSLGSSSFTLDPDVLNWDDCELFETFWSQQEEKMIGRLSPSNFYGYKVCVDAIDEAKRKKKGLMNQYGGGPPFGFEGRGIIWDKNILLGVRPNWPLDSEGGEEPWNKFADKPLVAFLLEEDKTSGTTRVVKSQLLKLDLKLGHGPCLVDLGRDGYLGIVHTTYCEGSWMVEVVTFKVKKTTAAVVFDFHDDGIPFLVCQVVRKVAVVKDFTYDSGNFHDAFCV